MLRDYREARVQSAALVKRYKETIGPEGSLGQIVSGLTCSCEEAGDRSHSYLSGQIIGKNLCVGEYLSRNHTPGWIEWGK